MRSRLFSVDIFRSHGPAAACGTLGADEKIRAQGRMLRLKTSLDHGAGLEGDNHYTLLMRTAAREALQLIDQISWTSDPDRKWYRALFHASTLIERQLKEAPVQE